MKKILAISVLALFGNGAMGSQDPEIMNRMNKIKVIGSDHLDIKKPGDYLPREFWNDTECIRSILNEVVPEAEERAHRGRCRLEARFLTLSSHVIKFIYPKIKDYMKVIGLPCSSESEIYNSVGRVPLSYYRTSTSENRFYWTDEEDDNEWENSETFLDYVGDIIGRPLSKRAEDALWLLRQSKP
ncbi:MAG: hypothetical protein LBF65_00395 [Holosporales bacterium]|jgi:hypothetical protein|nr:hypothetical protein [Holosporales bacterium]